MSTRACPNILPFTSAVHACVFLLVGREKEICQHSTWRHRQRQRSMGAGGSGKGEARDDMGHGGRRHLRSRHPHRVLRHVEAVLRQAVRPAQTQDHADGLPWR